jgi:hypothetical protein
MKTLKHLGLAALVVGGLLLPLAATHPQFAKADGPVVVGPAPNVFPTPEYKLPGHRNVVLDPSYQRSTYDDHVLKQGEAGSCRPYRPDSSLYNSAVGWVQEEENDHILGIPFRKCAYAAVSDLVVGFSYDLLDGIPDKTITRAHLFFNEQQGDWNDNGGKTGCVTAIDFGPRHLQSGPDNKVDFLVTDAVAELVSKQPGQRVGWEFVLHGALGINDLQADGSSSCMSLLSNIQLQVYYDVPEAAPSPLQVIESSTFHPECQICKVLGTTPAPAPVPTLPDFKVPTVGGDTGITQGMTSVYSIGVSNLGTRPQTQVQVSIQVTGSVQYIGMTQTPAGWDCTGTAPILCVGPLGGSGDPVQSLVATFQVRVLAAKAGVGAITVTADPNGLISESNETNNADQLIVTVK